MDLAYVLDLVHPLGRRYRPALPPDDPLLRAVQALAGRDEEWSLEEQMELRETFGSATRLWQEYMLARHPEALEAPASWPSTLSELAIDALSAAMIQRVGPRSSVAVVTMVTFRRSKLRGDARCRAARRLGLTAEDAPRYSITPLATFLTVSVSLALKLRWGEPGKGVFAPVPSWEFWLAVGLIREVQERQSWRQAMRTSAGRPVSSD